MTGALRAVVGSRSGSGSGTVIFQNDRADVADLCGADGVHVGQDDLAVAEVKRIYPHLRSGLSTHSLGQLRAALSLEPPSYLAFGPVYPTRSKVNAEPVVGLESLRKAFGECSAAKVPLVAIGGIGEDQILEVAASAHLVAAISLLLPSKGTDSPYQWIEQRCRDIQQRICEVPLSSATE